MTRERREPTRVGITGSKGLLGSTLFRSLVGTFEAATIASDIRDPKSLARDVQRIQPMWIIHAAAKTDIAACEKDPSDAFAVNAEGTHHVVEAARSVGAKVLYVSTASVFKGDRGDCKENDMPEPNNVYDRSKVRGEEYVRAYGQGAIARLNVMGIHPDGSRGKNFMEWLVDSFTTGKDVNLFDDVRINALSNWTIANIFVGMIEQGVGPGTYHIGTSDVRSKAEIGEEVLRHFPKYRGSITRGSVDFIKDSVSRPKEMWLNCDYTARTLRITMPTMREEIDRIFKNYQP